MLRRVHVSHSRWGYALRVTDTPRWAATIGWGYETVLMGLLGHPCCGRGSWGRLPDPIGDRICTLAHQGLTATSRVEWNRERLLVEVPVTAEQAKVLLPRPVDDDDDQEEDDEQQEERPEEDGILLDARCPWCDKDFAGDAAVTAWAINLLRLHMNRRECRDASAGR